ncbi:hypothetical protein EMIHUDRAFT_240443 [Emiliania huxleyi CCMP1516]|uniref:RING-type E3 ubiquitin transferase n=2 Tax=Emiliania huxleyi TaxID=2903 RepID=A0A0D3JFX1_EMIH1|nr:hypothetical protein EMIHUDRAFT_240443 [Emiliania huxleyi CCMP1516]EOD22406.1 hypothetical protein EMIHUDRAFT_240443 [Emiliania huxleyi CCMP1516]|eukprot:XP_005774835.1 hypothetical protein EMIHUDRAFT_240443 [Emiliania huxleyi CCMP1516]
MQAEEWQPARNRRREQRGIATGSACPFSHECGSGAAQIDTPCRFFAAGHCANGSRCPFRHGPARQQSAAAATPPPLQRSQQPEERQQPHPEGAAAAAVSEVRASLDVACGVCLEQVRRCVPAGLFGIQSGCSHTICLACIRTWRASHTVSMQEGGSRVPRVARSCPECRVLSHYVVPSAFVPESAERKAMLIDGYLARLKHLPLSDYLFAPEASGQQDLLEGVPVRDLRLEDA